LVLTIFRFFIFIFWIGGGRWSGDKWFSVKGGRKQTTDGRIYTSFYLFNWPVGNCAERWATIENGEDESVGECSQCRYEDQNGQLEGHQSE
jgi:hypothetical protein